MNDRSHDRVFAGLGILSVVLMFASVALGGPTRMLTISSSASHIADAISKPAGTAAWTGAYIELLSFGCFVAFAIWACGKLGGGLLGQIARSFATSYATVSIVSLGVMDAITYRAGKGMSVQLASSLVTVNEALFVCTWFLAVFFLCAVAPLARASGRRYLGGSALAIAALMLVTTAVSLDNAAQLAFTFWSVWIVAASITLGRGPRAERPAPIPQHA